MGLERLSKWSTACEICYELGSIDPRYNNRECVCKGLPVGDNTCLQKDRTIIKLLYLNLERENLIKIK